ncbi:hypothetical protein BWI93_04380 [Siphonobacter sp. BAB-5385]|uniref:hypothetical protein n=1 Tax=Siphonobacter sp. BAB-5385 TaxID=1864822 RepID=UPI000BC9F0B5|nr:hypothetical protein [Siphonobacter sp. BAB-5385]OZI09395.1 hypothetical protein BWI93_04380 [Siphonobacter sp. BAB-5385]
MSLKKSIAFVALLVGLVPIFWYFSLLHTYALNIPKWDDHGLRAFIERVESAETLGQVFQAFWRQHNEHRIVYDRIISFLDYTLTGKLNFVHLMWVGNASLLLLLVVWGKALQPYRSLAYLLPLPFLLFNLSQWENMYWGMAALQNFSVVAWVACGLYALSYHRTLGWAIGWGILAGITSTNGLLLWPIGAVLLFLRSSRKKAWLWTGLGILFWILYFLHYNKTEQPTQPVTNKVLTFIRSVLLFSGSVAEPLWPRKSTLVVLATGALLVLAALGMTTQLSWKAWRLKLTSLDTFLLGMLAFVGGTTVMVAIGRMGFDEATFMTSRYKIYTILLTMLVYTWLLMQVSTTVRKAIGVTASVLGVAILLGCYSYFYDDTLRLRNQLLSMQFNWTYPRVPVKEPLINDPAPAWYDAYADDMIKGEFARWKPYPISLQPSAAYTLLTSEGVPTGKDFLDSYYLLRSLKKSYLVPFGFTTTTQPFASPTREQYVQPVSQTAVSHAEYEPGLYLVFVIRQTATGSPRFYQTGRSIHIQPRPQTPALPQNW